MSPKGNNSLGEGVLSTESEQGRETLEDVLQNPKIREVMETVRKNKVLAEILGEQHTTQGFGTAEELAMAFQGELTELPEEAVAPLVEAAKVKYEIGIAEAGITDKDLRNILKEVWIYSRLTSPTHELYEKVVSLIEGHEKTASFASGLAGINAVVDQFTESANQKTMERAGVKTQDELMAKINAGEKVEYVGGDTIVVIGSVYGGTFAQMEHRKTISGRNVVYMPITEFLEKGLLENTKLVLFESCNNPTLKVMPVKEIVADAKRVGALTVGDNTFSPMSVNLKKLGVDFTVVSNTKYYNGKSEDLGGTVSGRAEHINQLLGLHNGQRMLGGAIMAPRVAKKLIGNLSNLPERLCKATQNARGVVKLAQEFGLKARSMETDPQFEDVRNPDMSREIANGMVALYLDSQEEARYFVNTLIKAGIGKGAVSLGCETTYYSMPAETTHSEMPPEEQVKVGITPGLIRLSCGTEPDLVENIRKVFEQIKGSKNNS